MTDTDRPGDRPLTYRDAGVDIDAGNALVSGIKRFAESTARPGADGKLGGFGGLFDLKAAGYRDPILVAANDGVGTKLKIAIETGKHDTVGIDLVAMCVNDLVVQAAEPLFFLDYFATGRLEVGVAEAVVSGIAEGCRQAGCALIGGETAEMPGMYSDGDYDLAGFAVGAAERDALLPRADINAGDAIIGIASSGVHSNGFSLVRRLLADQGLGWDAPAPFADGQTFGEALLTPTTIYVRALQSALSATGGVSPSGTIKAISHITGGGLDENIPRVLPGTVAARIDLDTWTPPEVFRWIADSARLGQAEMLRTFNCGIGMVVIADAGHTSSTVAALKAAGVDAWVIGDVTAPAGERSEAKGRGDAWAITYQGALF